MIFFWTLRVAAFSRWALIRGWALVYFKIFTVFSYRFSINKTKKKAHCSIVLLSIQYGFLLFCCCCCCFGREGLTRGFFAY